MQQDEDHTLDYDSTFYYRLFRKLFFFPKLIAMREGQYNIDEIKIMSLPEGFERFFLEDEYSGRVSRFGFIAMLISCLSGKHQNLVELDYWNDLIQIGNSDGKVVVMEIPLCSLFAAILFALPRLNSLCGDEMFVLTPKRLKRYERFPAFCDLWYAFEDRPRKNNILEWDVDDDREIFPYSLNVSYSIFKKVSFSIEFTNDWKELKLEVGFWMDY